MFLMGFVDRGVETLTNQHRDHIDKDASTQVNIRAGERVRVPFSPHLRYTICDISTYLHSVCFTLEDVKLSPQIMVRPHLAVR